MHCSVEGSERSSPIVGAERNRMLAFIFPRRRPIGKLCAAKRSLSTHFYSNKNAPAFTGAQTIMHLFFRRAL